MTKQTKQPEDMKTKNVIAGVCQGCQEAEACCDCHNKTNTREWEDKEIKQIRETGVDKIVAIEMWLEESLGLSEGLSELIAKQWLGDVDTTRIETLREVVRLIKDGYNHSREGIKNELITLLNQDNNKEKK